jgi:subtilisin family serine protease
MIIEEDLLKLALKDTNRFFKVVVWSGKFVDSIIIGVDAFKDKGLKLLEEMGIYGIEGFFEEIYGIYGLISAFVGKIRGRTIVDLKPKNFPLIYKIETVKEFRICLKDSARLISIDKSHEKGIFGKGVKVGVVDTGVDSSCSLRNKVPLYRNFVQEEEEYGDYSGHGTHVAGIIAGSEEVYRGVAPGAEIISAKVLNKEGIGDEEQVANGMMWTYANGVEIINLSLGSRDVGPNNLLNRLCDALASKGVVIVAAAGNDGPKEGTIGSPGSSKNAITIGAVDKHGRLTSYSSRGPVDGIMKPDLLAPGGIKGSLDEGIISTRSSLSQLPIYPDECHTSLIGTSIATPHVSGSAALILEVMERRKIKIKNKHFLVKEVLTCSAKDLGYKRNEQGAGLVDVDRALRDVEAYAEEDVMKEEANLIVKDLASVLVPSAVVGISSVLLGALILPLKQNAQTSLQELYSQIDEILNILDERMYRLNEGYKRGMILPEQYSEEMIRINQILLKLNELIKRIK